MDRSKSNSRVWVTCENEKPNIESYGKEEKRWNRFSDKRRTTLVINASLQKTPLYTPLPYYERRSDNQQRWSIINENLTDGHKNVLDVGCAEGFFTAKMAGSGRFSLGIDTNKERLRYARKEWDYIENLGFMNLTIDPENIENIPAVDSTLFLAVHRHWVREYGWENSIDMFSTLCENSDMVFYEPVGDRPLPDTDQNLDPDESIEHYTNFLNKNFDQNITILDVQMVPHYGDNINRRDPLFVLDTQTFE